MRKKRDHRHRASFLAFILQILKIILRHGYYFSSTDKEAKSEKSDNLLRAKLIPSRGWIQTQGSRGKSRDHP